MILGTQSRVGHRPSGSKANLLPFTAFHSQPRTSTKPSLPFTLHYWPCFSSFQDTRN